MTLKCKICGDFIQFVKTKEYKNMPVQAHSFHGEDFFDPAVHIPHWYICPGANVMRKDYKKINEMELF
jgi:hypothetical protein